MQNSNKAKPCPSKYHKEHILKHLIVIGTVVIEISAITQEIPFLFIYIYIW